MKKKKVNNKKLTPNVVFLSIFITTVALSLMAVYIATSNIKSICSIEFDSSGGTLINGIETRCGEVISKPNDPEKIGFNFLGWYLDEDTLFDFSLPIEKDTILFAKWESDGTTNIFTVTFDTNGGSDIAPIEVSEGESITKPLDPEKSGYEFEGWYLNKVLYDFESPIYENITLVAQYTKKGDDTKNYNCQYTIGKKVNNILSIETGTQIKKTLYGFESNKLNKDCSTSIKVSPKNGVDEKSSSLTFNKEGTYTVTSCIVDTKTKTELECAKQTFKVVKKTEEVVINNISFSPVTFDIAVGDTFNLKLNSDPSEYSFEVNQNATFTSSDNSIVHYANGTFKANKAGNATITATYKNLSTNINVTVIPKIVAVKSISASPSNMTLTLNSTEQINVTINPNDATNKNYTFQSQNIGIATVTSTGLVKAVGVGSTTIFVTSDDNGVQAKVNVTVSPIYVTSVNLDSSGRTIYIDEKYTLSATVSPSNATNKEISWESSNSNVAKVDAHGVVTGVSVGTAYITAKSVDGSKTATAEIIVRSGAVTGIRFTNVTGNSIDLKYGASKTLTYQVEPDYAKNKDVRWEVSSPNLSMNNGTITAVGTGSVVVTVTTVDGNYSASLTVNITTDPLTVNPTIVREGDGVRYDLNPSGGTSSTGTCSVSYVRFYVNNSFKETYYGLSQFIFGFKTGSFRLEYSLNCGETKTGTSQTFTFTE